MLPSLLVSQRRESVDTEVIFCTQNSGGKLEITKGAPYESALDKLRKGRAFSGAAKTIQYVRFGGEDSAENGLFVGLGKTPFGVEAARVAGALVWGKLKAEKASTALVRADLLSKRVRNADAVLEAFLEGALLASYKFEKYKLKAGDEADGCAFQVFAAKSAEKAKLSKLVERVTTTVECVNLCRDWSNEPPNYGTPENYAKECEALAKKHGLKCKIYDEAECKKEGMGLFLGVGAGSDREGRMVVLEYTPKKANKNTKTLALVGKGITFDSGGISIKPALKMEEMKHDMTGAATMVSATILSARRGCPNKIVTVLAFTENMPSGKAIVPSTILKSRSGKSVEIVNTDAEGRLILADALDLAQDYKPDAVIDAATLTGAVGIALGQQACAVLGNDDSLIQSIIDVGADHFERAWQLPLFDEYFEDMKSDWADMKNAVNNPLGGTIRGAIFLKQFIREGMRWAHMDIAYTAHDVAHLAYCPKHGASGLHVRTLAALACDF